MDSEQLKSSASDASIIEGVRVYAGHTTRTRHAHPIDGLKPIHRRILWTLGIEDKTSKVTPLMGKVMGTYHPHGDNSIIDAIIRLAQGFNNVVPFVMSRCNVGGYSGGNAGAGRYLRVTYHPWTRAVFFTGVNKDTFKYVTTEYGNGVEPLYFIPRIPTALLTGNYGIATGFKSNIPMCDVTDVCNLVIEYVTGIKDHKSMNSMAPSLCKYLMFNAPIPLQILNAPEVLKQYQAGNFTYPTKTEGYMSLAPNAISIHTLPYMKPIETMRDRIDALIRDKDHIFSTTLSHTDEKSPSPNYAAIKLILRRGVDPFDILDEVKKVAEITQNFNPCFVWANDDGLLLQKNFLEILEMWYKARYQSIVAAHKHDLHNCILDIRKHEALVVVKDNAKAIQKIYREAKNTDDTIDILNKKYGLSAWQVKYLSQVTNAQYTEEGRDDLLAALNKLYEKKSTIQYKFDSVDDQIIADAEQIRDTFGKQYPRNATTPKYRGYIQTDKGVIQFKDYKEFHMLINRFDPAGPAKVVLYPKGSHKLHRITADKFEHNYDIDFPGIFTCKDFYFTKWKPTTTVGIRESTIYRLRGEQYRDIGVNFHYVGDDCIAIHVNGLVELIPTASLPLRKSIDAHGNKTDIIHVHETCDKDTIMVAHVNTTEQNTVRLSKVRLDKPQTMMIVPCGELQIIGVYQPNDPCIINIPEDVLSRCNINKIFIKTPIDLFEDGETDIIMYVNRALPKGAEAVRRKMIKF